MKINENTNIGLPLRNLIGLIGAIVIGAWFAFGVIERLNKLETADILFKEDLLKRAEQEPKNLEIFMLLEELFKQTDKQQLSIDQNIHTQIKLDHLEEQLSKALIDIERLKANICPVRNKFSTLSEFLSCFSSVSSCINLSISFLLLLIICLNEEFVFCLIDSFIKN